METPTENLFKDTPEGLQPLTVMDSPNEVLVIHEGPFQLTSGQISHECIGKIEFCWLPTRQIRFSGVTTLTQQIVEDYREHTTLDIVIEETITGKGILTHFSTSNLHQIAIRGQVDHEFVTGNKTVLADCLRFEIPNLKPLHGAPIRYGSGASRGRLSLEDDNYLIYIDKTINFSERYNLLQEEGGFVFTYTGSLIKKGKSISCEETGNIMRTLHYFLSFINGRRTSPLFVTGMFDGEVVWTMYNSNDIDSYRQVWSWVHELKTESLPELWKRFSFLLKVKKDCDWLTTSIHWYIEANRKAGYAEGAIMIAQCALELLYNRVIIEEKKILKGDEATKLNAANKIRLLLSTLGISHDIPVQLSNTISFNNNTDGPGILVEIRNAIVHGQEGKRKKLQAIPGVVLVEVLNLGTLYVELVLLKLLGYKGPYFNRCVQVTYQG